MYCRSTFFLQFFDRVRGQSLRVMALALLVAFLGVAGSYSKVFALEPALIERFRVNPPRSVLVGEVDAKNEGVIVRLTGELTTEETLTDPNFRIKVEGLRLKRTTDMYQWNKASDSDYETVWSPTPIDSTGYIGKALAGNPDTIRYETTILNAKKVKLGAFDISEIFLNEVKSFQALPPSSNPLPKALKQRAHYTATGYYLGTDPQSPEVGDLRISHSALPFRLVTIIAVQSGGGLKPVKLKSGKDVVLIAEGDLTVEQLVSTLSGGKVGK